MLAARRNCSKRLSGKKVSTVYLDVCVVLSQNSVLTFSPSMSSTPIAAGERAALFRDVMIPTPYPAPQLDFQLFSSGEIGSKWQYLCQMNPFPLFVAKN